MTEQEARDILNLHIYLGKKSGYDVSELIEMQQAVKVVKDYFK